MPTLRFSRLQAARLATWTRVGSPKPWSLRSIYDEERRAHGCVGAVRLRLVRNLVAHTGSEREPATILELCVQLTFHTQQHVALGAPVIGKITGRVLNYPNPDVAELAG